MSRSGIRGYLSGCTAILPQPGQDGMVRSRKRLCLTSEISAYFSHVLVQGRTRRYIPPRTENHGVPGSNPGPATQELPANGEKRKSLGGVAGALCNSASTAGQENASSSASAAASCMLSVACV